MLLRRRCLAAFRDDSTSARDPNAPGRTTRLGAEAVGARATGSQAVGTLVVAAVAIGAVAIGALAIGRLVIGRARIRRLEIDELVVRRLRVIEQMQSPPRDLPQTATEPAGPAD